MATQQKLPLLTQARQQFLDLFRWKQRVSIIDENGNETIEYQAPVVPTNPVTLLWKVSAKQWLFYWTGFFCWFADAFDFHALSIQTSKIATFYDASKSDISTAITLTLLLRSVGAVFFGIAGDYFGRKYPMVLNMFMLGALQVGSIYARTFGQFLAARALFGICMGGVFGNAAAMSLENVPAETRGILSGIFQSGYSFGYVVAACVNLGVGGAPDSWRTAFWVGAGLSFSGGFLRLLFPESKQFIEKKKSGDKGGATNAFLREFKKMIRKEWQRVLYTIVLMAIFNFYSHTTQDSYTTFLLTQKRMNNSLASKASILMKTGACVGGTTVGWASQFLGRRRCIAVCGILCCCIIPAWVLPDSFGGLAAGGFILQFFVQGAWGVIPIHLAELSPPAFRASFPGLTYQLGNMISSPAAQIVNEISERTTVFDMGARRQAYGPTMAIATAIISLSLTFWISIGPERKGSHFETCAAAGAEPSLGVTANHEQAPQEHKEEHLAVSPAEDGNSIEKSSLHGSSDESKKDLDGLQTRTTDA